MASSPTERAAQHQFDRAGIDVKINGDRSSDIRILNPGVYRRAAVGGVTGLGEAYMDGWWECDNLEELLYRIASAPTSPRPLGRFGSLVLQGQKLAVGRQSTAKKVGETHYDIGNDLYEKMLDSRLTYTCGYWGLGAKNLEEAQQAKLERSCQKLHLAPGQSLLDIGSGWGSLMGYAAEKFGVHATGLTVSKEQAAYANKRYQDWPVKTLLEDYRDFQPTTPFDRVASLGMFEHVGRRSYRTYMHHVNRCLADNGIFLLHTIGCPKTTDGMNPWIAKYIFPHSELPSQENITQAVEGIFKIEHWENFGPDYHRTLMAWLKNCEESWSSLGSHYDERFRRMWRLYLASCAGAFRARRIQLWQVVLTKLDNQNEYHWNS